MGSTWKHTENITFSFTPIGAIRSCILKLRLIRILFLMHEVLILLEVKCTLVKLHMPEGLCIGEWPIGRDMPNWAIDREASGSSHGHWFHCTNAILWGLCFVRTKLFHPDICVSSKLVHITCKNHLFKKRTSYNLKSKLSSPNKTSKQQPLIIDGT